MPDLDPHRVCEGRGTYLRDDSVSQYPVVCRFDYEELTPVKRFSRQEVLQERSSRQEVLTLPKRSSKRRSSRQEVLTARSVSQHGCVPLRQPAARVTTAGTPLPSTPSPRPAAEAALRPCSFELALFKPQREEYVDTVVVRMCKGVPPCALL